MRAMYVNSTSKRRGRRPALVGLALAASLIVGACGSDDDGSSDDTEATATTQAAGGEATTAAPATTAGATETTAGDGTATTAGGEAPAGDLAAVEAACQAEGKVNLIALPDEWANYKGILASFGEKYPDVDYDVANPNASSQEEMDAVKTLAGQDGMPDSVDVSPAIAQSMVSEGLFAPYTATLDAEVPEVFKDPDHNWYASYYGIMAIITNTTIVEEAPKTFADLKDPKYEGQINLNGDPRQAGSAFAAVMAASLANGGSPDDIMPGIEFFAELKASGNLGGTDVTPATVLSGETPIALDWSYNLPGLREQLADAGLTAETNFPSDGVYGGYYVQGVVADSPHQACSQLWLEHILGDDGALGYLQGGAIPARYEALVEAGKVTEADKANLPPAELIDQIEFLTPEQIAAANEVLQANWGPMVADA
jgi:putative spermidine/putrescine transport system substrate-binding protein